MIGQAYEFQFVEAPSMVVPGEPYETRRTWRERLFSLPWRPLQRTLWVTPMVPSTELIQYGNRIVGHPATLREVIRRINEQPGVRAQYQGGDL